MKEKTKEIESFIKKYYKLIIIFICLIGTIELIGDIFEKDIMRKDVIGYHLVSTYLMSDTATIVAKFITNFGGAIVLIGTTIILVISIRNRRIGLSIIANLGIITGLNIVLKQIVQRPRPTEYRIINETGYSFPSGHSMVSMAFYGFLIYLIYKYVKNQYLKIGLISFLSILIISIGISRIYLGVHYTSDVMAGFCISVSYLVLYVSSVSNWIKASD